MKRSILRSPFRSIQNLRRFQEISGVFLKHGFGFVFENFGPEARGLRRLIRQPLRKGLEGEHLTEEELAVHFRLALEELGPTYIKLGQMLSTRPDILPPGFIQEMSLLQDNVAPLPWEEIKQVAESELGKDLDELFIEVDEFPIGSASLAQVHAAKLPDGNDVVLKVQRPGILKTIDTDLEILMTIAKALQQTTLGTVYNLNEVLDEFSYTLHNELDYVREGHNADKIRESFSGENDLCIPKIYWDYSTKKLLVMEQIRGIKISNIEEIDQAGFNRKKIAENAANLIVKEILEDGFFHADPHPGNFLVMENGVLGALDFGMVGYLRDVDRLHLIQLFIGAVDQDVDALIDQFIRVGAADIEVDQLVLARDLSRLLNYVYGLPLKDLHIDDLLSRAMPVVYRHKLKFPSNYWLLAKTLAQIEGIGLELDPDFDIFEFAKPHVKKLTTQLLFARKNWAQNLLRKTTDWGDLLDEFPRTANRLMEQAERGELFRMSINDADKLFKIADRLVTRVSLSLLVASLILGMSFLIPIFSSGSLAQIVVILAFGIAVTLGVWMLLTMLRLK